MIDCNIINDLIFVYTSGEASPQTQQLVESHITTCPDCAKAIERVRLAETMPLDWETPSKKPANGRHFISRLQRTLFIVGTGILMLFTFGWAAWHRFVLSEIFSAEGIHLQLPLRLVLRTSRTHVWLAILAFLLIVGWQWWQRRHPQAMFTAYPQLQAGLYLLLSVFAYNLTGIGRMPGILIGGLLLLGLFIATSRWRMQQPPAEATVEWLRSGITAVPLLGLTLAAINTITTGQLPGIFIAPSLLFVGLVYAYYHLPRLPHLSTITLISLLFVNGLLALRAIHAFVSLLINGWLPYV